MKFKFRLEEHLQRDFVIEAPNQEMAEAFLHNKWMTTPNLILPEDSMDDYKISYLGKTEDETADFECRPIFAVVDENWSPENVMLEEFH